MHHSSLDPDQTVSTISQPFWILKYSSTVQQCSLFGLSVKGWKCTCPTVSSPVALPGAFFGAATKDSALYNHLLWFRVKHSTQFEQRTWWMRSSTAVSPVTSIGTLVLRDRTLNSGSCPVDNESTLDLFRFARQNFDVELSSLIQASELQAQSPRTTLICQLFWQLLRFSYVFQFCYTEWRHLHYTEYVKANKEIICMCFM